MNSTNQAFYRKKSDEFSAGLTAVSKKIKWFALYRFSAFALIVAPLFWLKANSLIPWFVSGASGFLFFFLIKKNNQLEKRKISLSVLKKITTDELLALEHSFSHFYNGSEFTNTEHFYSYDLDLFGEGSLFQFLNRTSTIGGRHKLFCWLTAPPLTKTDIEKKQEAIRELAQAPEWRLHFLAEGRLFNETTELSHEIKAWSSLKMTLNHTIPIKWMLLVIPLLTVLSIVPAITGFSNKPLVLMVVVQWLLLYFFRKRVTEYFRFFGRKSALLAKYMQLLKRIEGRQFKAAYLVELQNKITRPELASELFIKLKNLVEEFEYRQNMLVGFFLNSLFLWDIRCVFKLWSWHGNNHEKLAEWLSVIVETDALLSLANYADNHPDFTFPEIREGDFIFRATNLGHPLLHPQKRVCNDLEIDGWSKILIVTGANMAGKSTFLRTVGVNLILARTGAPVCADKMTVTPISVYTNMRTNDSLLKDESYFFAELKRIKGVLERLQKGEPVFVILDEMLKGTNSIDKLNGSKELIRKLAGLKSVSLIATHDLKLSEMEKELPENVSNKCFEIKIKNNEMIFDYCLSEGVTKTMNATFLMKKMGII